MSLFPIWSGTVCLPPTPERRLSVGKNFVIQQLFPGASVNGTILDSQHKGYDLLKTSLSPPYRELLIKRQAARRIGQPYPTVRLTEGDYSQGTKQLTFEWVDLGEIGSFADSPEKVVRGWKNKFALVVEDDDGERGLLPPSRSGGKGRA